MAQMLHTRAASATPIDRYRLLNGLQEKLVYEQKALTVLPLSEYSDRQPPKRNRNRGVILSQQGWQKLVQAEVLHDQFGRRYTHEQLSERSLLDVRTISRLLSCEVKVDKSTMRTFFRAFNLQLDAEDYTTPVEGKTEEEPLLQKPPVLAPASAVAPDVIGLVEELLQLKQHVVEECDRLLNRLGLNEIEFNNLQK